MISILSSGFLRGQAEAPLRQGQFVFSGQGFDAPLQRQGGGSGSGRSPKDKGQRSAPAQVSGRSGAGARVLGEAPGHVGGDARVEAAVGAADDVNEPGSHDAGRV